MFLVTFPVLDSTSEISRKFLNSPAEHNGLICKKNENDYRQNSSSELLFKIRNAFRKSYSSLTKAFIAVEYVFDF